MKIELFPCSGGMAEGFRRAGVTFDLAIDHDADACNSYEKNLGHRPLQMDVNDFHRLVVAGWRPAAPLDLLVADPPCTPWSRAGKRQGVADERDCLVVTTDLIRLLRPRAYLIGNVPGLQDSTQWNVVQRLIGSLRDVGYCVRDYVSLDAADYGVAQHRVRPFWFGHLEGPCIVWPAPTHAAPTEQLAIGGHALAPWVTCRAALGHLPLEELGRPVKMRIREKGEDGTRHGGDLSRCSAPDTPAKTVVSRQFRKGGQILIPNGTDPSPAKPKWVPTGGDKSLCSTPDRPAKVVGAHEGIKGGQILIPNASPKRELTGNDAHPMSELDEHPRHPVSSLDEPSMVIKTGGGRASGNGSTLRLSELTRDPNDTRKANYSSPDSPALTITRNTHSEGATLLVEPSLVAGRGSRPQSARVLSPDEPSTAVQTKEDRQDNGAVTLEWPWNRPATTILGDERLSVPGHHDATVGNSSHAGPNAIVLSEKAAAILQGFPDGWLFSGDTKRARWGQIGMAMPPPLAHAVATAVAEQMAAAARAASTEAA